MNKNMQESFWSGEFGEEYTERNICSPEELDKENVEIYGISRMEMNKAFLSEYGLENKKILEVGCNVGNQLRALQKMGYNNLYGIELQPYAVQRAKDLTKGINIIQGSGYNIPFQDEYFDMVFTSGVLIHIAPDNLHRIMKEIVRCSKRFVWGFEYYSEHIVEVSYRGNSDVLWKGDYAKEYIKNYPQLKLIKQKQYKYIGNDNIDEMFLLSK